ncbi:response regulator [Flavobacterium frigoris]|uniref:Response regulator receiver domain-containing protein n=1 Tax=Flavobacterium frigoris TaxID=229204 RepID=A0A1H9N1X4_FLAFI|nr:response regulator [Flavobacterium frigoris]SER29655.1 Response regulator receiver domain-containing protein [Flavobacterium frigoris]
MTKKKIWVIDDDAIYQIIITKIIQKTALFSAISSFRDGKEGIVALINTIENKELLPDIILLDINMPVMDGWEFMEEMGMLQSLKNENISVYIASSSIAIEDRNKSKKYPAILGYLSKPISLNDIELIASND